MTFPSRFPLVIHHILPFVTSQGKKVLTTNFQTSNNCLLTFKCFFFHTFPEKNPKIELIDFFSQTLHQAQALAAAKFKLLSTIPLCVLYSRSYHRPAYPRRSSLLKKSGSAHSSQNRFFDTCEIMIKSIKTNGTLFNF